jgi:hypothetical protein
VSDAEQAMIRAFGLGDDGWRRHANPWSVYTRIPIPAMLALAVWSRTWIGRWSLLPIATVGLWTAVNPRAFPPPRSADRWATQAVLGEQLWTAGRKEGTPPRRRIAPVVLTGINTVGMAVLVRGLVVLDPWMTAAGLAVHMAGKNWFLDRMVWHYEDATREQATAQGSDVPAPLPTTPRRDRLVALDARTTVARRADADEG